MPYQSTWNNPYLAQNPYQQVMGQQMPAQQAQLAQGWSQSGWQQPYNGIVKVNGRESAMQIQLPPNSTSQPLIDSNSDGKVGMFYVVSTDGTGSKSVEVFDFAKHVDQPKAQVPADVVSRDEFNMALGVIDKLKGEISELRAAIPPAV